MSDTKDKLESAASGLLMMSEADYPFDYFTTEGIVIDSALALKLADKPAGTFVEEITLDYLLRNLTDESRGSVTPESAQQFKIFATTVKQELSGIKVLRVGSVQVDVFILGFAADGTIAGMRTKLIET